MATLTTVHRGQGDREWRLNRLELPRWQPEAEWGIERAPRRLLLNSQLYEYLAGPYSVQTPEYGV